MAVIPNQKFRFLGGEVSPNLYHSADMEQYGRWFSKAENIRFDTLGAFRNRNGFAKIAQTKVSNGTEIKLLSFNFSKDESYLIEMGPGYFRFFEDGVPVYKNGDPEEGVYEISHNMSIIDGDIKYAQSGDIMYLVNGVDPIGTLTRNDTTGYNWTFDTYKFKNDCAPLKEVNTDDTKTLSISSSSSGPEQFMASSEINNVIASGYTTDVQELSIDIVDSNSTVHSYSVTGEYIVSVDGWGPLIEDLNDTGLYGFTASISNNVLYLDRADGATNPITSITIKKLKYDQSIYVFLIENSSMTRTISPTYNGLQSVSSSGMDFFANKSVGDTFAVEYEVGPNTISFNGGTSAAGTTTDTIITNGTFTAASTGAWAGEFVIEYSTDNTNWTVIKTVSSVDQISTHNINEVITVKEDADIIYVRARVTSTLSYRTEGGISYPLALFITGTKFSVNVYYKIVTIASGTSATCIIIKNDYTPATGVTWSGLTDWKEAAISSEEGYPSVVGFYQNRLLFGKEYYLFASKTNDFYDFYAKTTLTADDPITMSLLSYRYNRIKNILTVRKFFVFSEEGEFGIQSQGALTQTDKNLIPLSYHGSSDCLPVLAGNLALFVDQTGNCIRLFQYSYETDMFEANDSSVFLEQLLKGRKIVTTDYIKKSKEALFLDNLGYIWVFKLMPEQEVYAWSHWKYADSGKITNMRVVANGPEEDLYIAVEDTNLGEKRIEKLSTDKFYDSEKTYTSELRTNRFYTDFDAGTEIVAEYEGITSRMIVQDNGLIVLEKQVLSVTCHYIYVSTATLLSPATNLTEGVYTTYNKGKPFKVYFAYQDSFGFKVGLEEEEKMIVRFNGGDKPESSELTTGKRNVLIPARYDGSSRVTFIQDRPYNMSINNIMIDMDYGGK